MSLALVTPAARLPVTIDEIKLHARVEDSETSDDASLLAYARVALEHLEGRDGILNRALITQTWALRLDSFPASDDTPIQIPLPPLQSVSSITYVDSNGASQTWSSASYTVDANSQPGRVYPAYGAAYPTTRDQRDAVTVTFVAGYGDNYTDVPEPLRFAVLALAAHFFEHRLPVEFGGAPHLIPVHVARLLAPYRAVNFHAA